MNTEIERVISGIAKNSRTRYEFQAPSRLAANERYWVVRVYRVEGLICIEPSDGLARITKGLGPLWGGWPRPRYAKNLRRASRLLRSAQDWCDKQNDKIEAATVSARKILDALQRRS